MHEPVLRLECGYTKMKSASHKPWNEKEVNFSTAHILRHALSSFIYTVQTNSRVLILLVVFLVLVGGTVALGFLSIVDAVGVACFLTAMIVGLLVRTAKKEILVEGLQVWLAEAYGVNVPYEEAAIAYASFTHNKTEYALPHNGVMVRIPGGLIYRPQSTIV